MNVIPAPCLAGCLPLTEESAFISWDPATPVSSHLTWPNPQAQYAIDSEQSESSSLADSGDFSNVAMIGATTPSENVDVRMPTK